MREKPRYSERASAGPPGGKSICVFLAGNQGRQRRYTDEAVAPGCLMGALATAALGAGGFVTAVVPRQLSYQDLAHEKLSKLSRLIEVNTMHERKHRLQVLSQGSSPCPADTGRCRKSSKCCAGRAVPPRLGLSSPWFHHRSSGNISLPCCFLMFNLPLYE